MSGRAEIQWPTKKVVHQDSSKPKRPLISGAVVSFVIVIAVPNLIVAGIGVASIVLAVTSVGLIAIKIVAIVAGILLLGIGIFLLAVNFSIFSGSLF